MKYLRLAFFVVLGCFAAHVFAAADLLVSNGEFENGIAGWTVFVPAESKDKGCVFDTVNDAPHSGKSCARLQSTDFARFGVGAGQGIPVQPGEHYRVTAWVRADPAAELHAKAPGFVIRLNLRLGSADAAGGHLFISQGNLVSRDTPAESKTDLPKEWTKVEAVVEIPPGVDTMYPSFFSWWVKGTLFVDDFSIEKVDASTPATPLSQTGAGK
ncbi:MAG: carbohydrate binding domain-containing protein [Chthoniobacteraceae bacterium]